MNKLRILIDLNVILDVLSKRQPYYTASARIWELVETRQVEGMLAAHSFTTLFYLYSRQASREYAAEALEKLLSVFQVAAVDQRVIEWAVKSGWADFEDAVQMAAAAQANADYVITRNMEGFKKAPVPVIQPADFVAIFNATQPHVTP